jgi:hypothetical protein
LKAKFIRPQKTIITDVTQYVVFETGMTFFISAKWVQNSVKNYPLFERSEFG